MKHLTFLCSGQKNQTKSVTMRRARSTSSLMSTGSSCLMNRSIIESAQPLSNQRLKKTLDKTIDTSHVVVTPRVCISNNLEIKFASKAGYYVNIGYSLCHRKKSYCNMTLLSTRNFGISCDSIRTTQHISIATQSHN